MQKQGYIKKIFSLLTYKDSPDKEVFYIPEINEDGENSPSEINGDNNTSNKNSNTENELEAKNSDKGQEGQNIEASNQDPNNDNKIENKKSADKSQDTKETQKPDGLNNKPKRNFKIRNTNKEKSEENSQQEDKQQNKDSQESKPNKDQTKQKNETGEFKKPIPISRLVKKSESNKSDSGGEGNSDNNKSEIKKDIKSNIDLIKQEFNYPTNKDIVIREFMIDKSTKAFLVYLEGMVDRHTVNNFILGPILRESEKFKDYNGDCQLDFMLESVLETHQVRKVNTISDIITGILVGDTGVYTDGCDYFIFCETKGFEKRNVSTPQIEAVIRGSQEAFNENLRTNITLLRKIIKDKDFTSEILTVGDKNRLNVAVAYINGTVNVALVNEVKRRLNGIKTDYIGNTGMLEQFIEDSPLSIIPTILATERPDRAASHIMEGKLGILVDGSPFAIVAPVTITSLFHTPEDSSVRWQYGTVLRLIRIFAIFVAMMLPGLYVALTTFHTEMIPTELLIAIAKARENVPFPTIIEIVLMEVSFELIREAGIRIPGIVGNTIGIIGALILGQAAVQANLVSPVMIIIIAFTGLGSFAIPDFSLAFGIRILRVIFIIAGASLGFYGISLAMVTVGFMIVNLKTFGVPFVSTQAPRTRKSHDVLFHWPIWMQEFRPDNVNPANVRRQPDISRKWTKQKPYTSYDKDGDNG